MTITIDPADQRVDSGLDRALKAVSEALGRTDVKAGLLFGLDGGLGAWISSTANAPTAARILAVVASVFLVASIGLLAWAVLPTISDRDRCSFPHWATLTPEQILDGVREDRRHHEVHVLSVLAMTKFGRIRTAVASTAVAAFLLIVAADLTVLA